MPSLLPLPPLPSPPVPAVGVAVGGPLRSTLGVRVGESARTVLRPRMASTAAMFCSAWLLPAFLLASMAADSAAWLLATWWATSSRVSMVLTSAGVLERLGSVSICCTAKQPVDHISPTISLQLSVDSLKS